MDTVISNSADILILLVLVAAIAVLHALRKKGDVIATLSFLPVHVHATGQGPA